MDKKIREFKVGDIVRCNGYYGFIEECDQHSYYFVVKYFSDSERYIYSFNNPEVMTLTYVETKI